MTNDQVMADWDDFRVSGVTLFRYCGKNRTKYAKLRRSFTLAGFIVKKNKKQAALSKKEYARVWRRRNPTKTSLYVKRYYARLYGAVEPPLQHPIKTLQ